MAWIWLLIVLGIIVVLAKVIRRDFKPPVFCGTCGHQGQPKHQTPGSFAIELLLWLCLLLPGVIYTLWRLTSGHDVCANCGARTLMPVDSPVAVRAKQEQDLPIP